MSKQFLIYRREWDKTTIDGDDSGPYFRRPGCGLGPLNEAYPYDQAEAELEKSWNDMVDLVELP